MIICKKSLYYMDNYLKSKQKKTNPFPLDPPLHPHSLGPRRRSGICRSACGQEEVNFPKKKITHHIVLLFLDFLGGYFILGDDLFVMCAFLVKMPYRFFGWILVSFLLANCMLEVFCYRLTGDFKKFIQRVVKLTYAKEKQKSYFFL